MVYFEIFYAWARVHMHSVFVILLGSGFYFFLFTLIGFILIDYNCAVCVCNCRNLFISFNSHDAFMLSI
jgi:hypothetical protein